MRVREDVLTALEKKKDRDAVGTLLWALKDSGENVRTVAAWAFGKIEDSSSVELLIEALKLDEEPSVRANAADGLGKIEHTKAVKPLMDALEDEDSGIRAIVAEAIGEIKHFRTVGPLIDALKERDARVRANAIRELRTITGKDLSQDLEK